MIAVGTELTGTFVILRWEYTNRAQEIGQMDDAVQKVNEIMRTNYQHENSETKMELNAEIWIHEKNQNQSNWKA